MTAYKQLYIYICKHSDQPKRELQITFFSLQNIWSAQGAQSVFVSSTSIEENDADIDHQKPSKHQDGGILIIDVSLSRHRQ